MTSTGNDIVALQATQPEKTNLPRFYSRILTVDEKKLYDQLECRNLSVHDHPQPHRPDMAFDHQQLNRPPLPFDHFVWLCWSIKESAYKFASRNSPGVAFAPLKISIREMLPPGDSVDGYYRSRVAVGHEILYSRSLLQDGVVVTVVSEDEQFANIHWGFQPIGSSAYADQSASVRSFALEHLSATLSRDDLQVQMDRDGVPHVLAGRQRLDVPLSLAHHGHFVAWSFRH